MAQAAVKSKKGAKPHKGKKHGNNGDHDKKHADKDHDHDDHDDR